MTVQSFPEDYDIEFEKWIIDDPEAEALIHVPRQPKAYKTIMAKPISRFDLEVNKAMNQGWELYGDPYVASGGEFAQALVKYYVDTKEN